MTQYTGPGRFGYPGAHNDSDFTTPITEPAQGTWTMPGRFGYPAAYNDTWSGDPVTPDAGDYALKTIALSGVLEGTLEAFDEVLLRLDMVAEVAGAASFPAFEALSRSEPPPLPFYVEPAGLERTISPLEQRVLELIGEDPENPDVFTADNMGPIRESLNDAIQEVVMLTGGVKRKYLLPLRQESAFYRIKLESGYLGWVTDAWLVNQGRRLEQTDTIRITDSNPRWLQVTGTPELYLPIGADVIGFYPKPGANSDVVELTVVEIPRSYTEATDPVRIRDQFQYALVHYAVAEFWASRGDAQEAQKHYGQYLQALNLRADWNMIRDPRRFRTEKDGTPSN